MVLGLITRGVTRRAFCTKGPLNFYDALGVDEDVSKDDLRKAYRKLVFQTHPDRHPGDASKEAKFKIVNEAFTVLSNPQKKAEYDQRMSIRSEGSVVYSSMMWHRSENYESPYNTVATAEDVVEDGRVVHNQFALKSTLEELDTLFANLARQRPKPQKESKVLDLFDTGF